MKRQQYIKENYTQLPSLPEQIFILTKEITAHAQTDYEKLKAIETYLHQFPYSLTPPECPSDRDFVDFFLFDGKSGYCTYYATSMAVLARCAGIPTRYVEGFVVKNSNKYDHRNITLTGSDAHAWTEAYINNIGWVPFEPTPGYYETTNTPWPTKNSNVYSEIPQLSPARPTIEQSSATSDIHQEKKADQNSLLLALYILLLTVFLILLFFIFIKIRNMIRNKRYNNKSSYDKILYLMGRIFYIGKCHGYEKEESETLFAFEVRLENCLDTPSLYFSSVCTLFSAIRFGGKEIEHEDLLQIECYINELEQEYLLHCGFLKKLLYNIS